jgi:hypothetical protein
VKDIPIIFELVIVGFEVLAWLFLLVALFGYHWISGGTRFSLSGNEPERDAFGPMMAFGEFMS